MFVFPAEIKHTQGLTAGQRQREALLPLQSRPEQTKAPGQARSLFASSPDRMQIAVFGNGFAHHRESSLHITGNRAVAAPAHNLLALGE